MDVHICSLTMALEMTRNFLAKEGDHHLEDRQLPGFIEKQFLSVCLDKLSLHIKTWMRTEFCLYHPPSEVY